MDPRFMIAEVYKQLRSAGKSSDDFTQALNECDGPEDAIRICSEHLQLLTA